MARICNEVAVNAIGNRYDLVIVASERMRELNRGEPRLIDTPHQNQLTALLEIEQGLVKRDYLEKIRQRFQRKRREILE